MLIWCTVGFLGPVALLTTPVVMVTWRRTSWWMLDFVAILVPGPLWAVLAYQGDSAKTLSNLIELPLLAVVVSAAALARGLTGDRWPRLPVSVGFLGFTVLATLGTYYFLPPLPE